MAIIKYIKGNALVSTPKKRILIHSCNTNGSWGGGIAYQLAVRYPRAEDEYMRICDESGSNLLGQCRLISSNSDKENLVICCLFTSSFGGSSHDSSNDILKYTKYALEDLFSKIKKNEELKDYSLEMPKINSGIFGVPWEKTEDILKEFSNDVCFTVYTF